MISVDDVRTWARGLGKTPDEGIRRANEMLRFAGEDEMSAADRAFVVAAIKFLKKEKREVREVPQGDASTSPAAV